MARPVLTVWISQSICRSWRDCLSYLASAVTVCDLLLPSKTAISKKMASLIRAESLRKQNHADSLGRSSLITYNSLGRKQKMADSLRGSSIWWKVLEGSKNWLTGLYPVFAKCFDYGDSSILQFQKILFHGKPINYKWRINIIQIGSWKHLSLFCRPFMLQTASACFFDLYS